MKNTGRPHSADQTLDGRKKEEEIVNPSDNIYKKDRKQHHVQLLLKACTVKGNVLELLDIPQLQKRLQKDKVQQPSKFQKLSVKGKTFLSRLYFVSLHKANFLESMVMVNYLGCSYYQLELLRDVVGPAVSLGVYQLVVEAMILLVECDRNGNWMLKDKEKAIRVRLEERVGMSYHQLMDILQEKHISFLLDNSTGEDATTVRQSRDALLRAAKLDILHATYVVPPKEACKQKQKQRNAQDLFHINFPHHNGYPFPPSRKGLHSTE
ncbi:hypothetical protein FGO68_gene5887 [Halteria grandinella]|uniref:Uncharacterized protein n=1 Tax=Halteria grandinella TaxID=5974 RepID=A0A8J8NKR1_HALGN|nr:hypothetical protein FGO68_gene5887 [Halteria grandinella]